MDLFYGLYSFLQKEYGHHHQKNLGNIKYIGIPLILIGTFIVSFGVYILGIKNTYGLENGFTDKTPYKYTRNPQYLGDIILIVGLILFVNSLNLTVLFLLTIIIFIIMPFSEEIWLEEKYGNKYIKYKNKTSRFI